MILIGVKNMHIINITIHHANDITLEETVQLEAETLKELRADVKFAIETSYENASHLLKREYYPAKQIEMTLSVGKNNVIKNQEGMDIFIKMNDKYIKELISKEKTHRFFNKKNEIFDEDDYLEPFMNIVQLEKSVNTITRKYHTWKREQEEFETFLKKTRESKRPSP